MIGTRHWLVPALVVALGACVRGKGGGGPDPAAGVSPVSASQAPEPGLLATRPALEERAVTLERSGKGDDKREAAAIRARLQQGDFNVGDRVLVVVEGEKDLTDTFTVAPGRELIMPQLGEIPLQGVLRSEIEPYLSRRIGESLRDPIVHARAFVRLSVQGAVAKPGFYAVPTTALLSDPLMVAGGTLGDAKVKKMRIERRGQVLYEGQALQDAIAQGRTIDDMGLEAGDQYVLPGHHAYDVMPTLQLAALVLGLPLTIYELSHVF